MDLFNVLKKPVITEKSEILRREFNKYVFKVDRRATKTDIKKAVEKMFEVTVLSVNILNIKPEKARHGQKEYLTKPEKKAIVALKAGDSIKYFEGV